MSDRNGPPRDLWDEISQAAHLARTGRTADLRAETDSPAVLCSVVDLTDSELAAAIEQLEITLLAQQRRDQRLAAETARRRLSRVRVRVRGLSGLVGPSAYAQMLQLRYDIYCLERARRHDRQLLPPGFGPIAG